MNGFNRLKVCPGCHVARNDLLEMARVTHAPTGRVNCQAVEREIEKEEKVGHVARYYWLPRFLSS